MKTLPFGSIALASLLIVGCGGSGGSPVPTPTEPTDVAKNIDIRVPNSIEKAILGEIQTITIDASSSVNTELELNNVHLKSGSDKCQILSAKGLTYTFTTKDTIGECQFEYEVVPTSEAYVGTATAKTRVAVSQLIDSQNNETRVSPRACTSPDCTTVYATSEVFLPIYSAAYFVDGSNQTKEVDLRSYLGAPEIAGYTLEPDVVVLGKLDSTDVSVDTANYKIEINAPLSANQEGHSRIEYALTNGVETKLGTIDITISDTDGLNHAPTLTHPVYIYPDTIFVKRYPDPDPNADPDNIPDTDPIPNTDEFILNIVRATSGVGSITTGATADGTPIITMAVVSDVDSNDTVQVADKTHVSLYHGTVDTTSLSNGTQIKVDINRGGKHTLAYTVSDGNGGFITGLFTFRMPTDIYSYNQEWFDITVPTTSSNSITQQYLNVSTGNAADMTFSAPLATELAFFLDVPFRSVFVEEGGPNAKGPGTYVITTYSYSQAQDYCAMRNGRLPTINEMEALVEHQGNNLYSGFKPPYTKPHNWPTSQYFWVGKKTDMDKAYAFNLNTGTLLTDQDTLENVDPDHEIGFYTTCILFDEAGEIKNYSVKDMQQSREESSTENAWIQFQLLDPEGVVAQYEYINLTPSKGSVTNTDDTPIDYNNPPDLLTSRGGMIYFYYDICDGASDYATCISDNTQSSTITVSKHNRSLYLFPYVLTDLGESTSPVSIDLVNLYATNSGSSVTIHQADNPSDPTWDASIIRMPVTGEAMTIDGPRGGMNLFHLSSNTYKGGYLSRYPLSGENFSMMIGINECPELSSCSHNTSNSSVVIALHQGFLPISANGIFTTSSEISGASNYFFSGDNIYPGVKNNQNLAFNIRRDSGSNTFNVQTGRSFASGMSVGVPVNQMEYYWVDYDADTKKLRLYNSYGQDGAHKPSTVLREFNFDWASSGIDPHQPYYIVIGYYRNGGAKNRMVLATLKYKAWN